MKRKLTLLLLAALLAGGLFHPGCKKSSETGSVTLTVSVATGATGTPATGTYTHQVGDQVAYSYALAANYTNLTVLYDGTAVAASGTLSMTAGTHTLQAYATGNNTYTLAVTMTTGVNGTPANGTTTHAAGDKVEYSYTLQDGFINLGVTLDGVSGAPLSGTITFPESHSLFVHAEKQYDVLGAWTLKESYIDGSQWESTATFSGSTVRQGTVADSQGGSGTFTCDATVLKFNLDFPTVRYEYTGNFTTDTAASGTCKRIKKSDPTTYHTGSWSIGKSGTTATAASSGKDR